jgi:signal transduction histidine kinase
VGGIEGALTADGYRVSFSDNGPGVPPRDREKIFDKFTKAAENAADRPPGSGLGLAISRQIVEHFSGRIWLETPDSGGARFNVLLPFAQAAGHHMPQGAAASEN